MQSSSGLYIMLREYLGVWSVTAIYIAGVSTQTLHVFLSFMDINNTMEIAAKGRKHNTVSMTTCNKNGNELVNETTYL